MKTLNRIVVSSFASTRCLLSIAIALILALGITPVVQAQFTFEDVNPSTSNLDPTDADGATGGRVNGLATVAGSNSIFYAASEWGGIYKTFDGGLTWTRLDDHNPNGAWDVEVNPGAVNRVYATSKYDGRTTSIAGINVSYDSGVTWNHVAWPPAGTNCAFDNVDDELSGFGIAVDPDDHDDVYIGTNCGLAVSDDGGFGWDIIQPDPFAENDWIIDVVVHHGGIIDICGFRGHQRSDDGGLTWSAPSVDLPGGWCSIDASPDESDVIFATVGEDVYESDNGGVSWTNLGTPDSGRQGRIPFVEVNNRAGDAFDLWYGDIRLFRGECTGNAAGLRCPMAWDDIPDPWSLPAGWNGPFTRSVGGHDDVGDIVFDVTAGDDACPEVFSSDGGVYYNTDTTSPGCHDPNWEQPTITPHGLWLWAMEGVDKPGADMEDMYFGLQDNGTFGSTDAGATLPAWNNRDCCDGFDFAADDSNALHTVCCGSPRANKMYRGNPGLTSTPEINTYPADGLLPGFRFPDITDTFGQDKYIVLTVDCMYPDGIDNDGDGDIDEPDEVQGGCTGANNGDGGIYVTDDVTASPIVWTELEDDTAPVEPPTGGDDKICAVKAAVDGGTPIFYVQVGRCDGRARDELWRFVGTNPSGDEWTLVNLPDTWLSIFDVDPNDPERLFIASFPNPGDPRMMLTEDGGASWTAMPELDDLMIGGGDFKMRTRRGANGPQRFSGYRQPSMVAFDEEDENILAAGGWDSGVFLSTDRGDDWVRVTDPDSTGGAIPHLPQPRYAYFDHDETGGTVIDMYVGTRGRGVWRVTFDQPPVADANGPYTTDEGTDVALDGTGSFDPGGTTLTYEWDFDDDGIFDDATGATPDFDPVGDGVGQDGVYVVRLKVTNENFLSDIDDTTVTVNNVAPTVVFNPQDPEDEGAPLIVPGVISDPGWLDVLTGTIDWGDGSPIEDVGGVLENVRPDATLTFSIDHCYGDNGIYTVEVCGSDDDTTTCESVDVVIDNVAPDVAIDAGQLTEIDEGQVIDVLAHFSDPGWLDTYTSTIDWGYPGWMDPGNLVVTVEGSDCGAPDMGTVTGSKLYGDNDAGGGFTVTVAVTDDDGGVGADAFSLTVNNIDPTAEIDETNTVDVCGSPMFIAHAGEDVDFSGRSTDPGSDDLFLSWDWDDGPPAPDVTTDYLVGVPVPGSPDPLPSPEHAPRDVTDMKTHAFAEACYYNVGFLADDDDGGHGEDFTDVVIFGNNQLIRSAGYWYNQFRKVKVFTAEELECYLAIVNHMSAIFSEVTVADTIESAKDMMHPGGSGGEMEIQFDRQLMAVWLNMINGAIEYDELVDTDFDQVPDTELLTFLCDAEAARLDPTTTRDELEALKDLLEAINLLDDSVG